MAAEKECPFCGSVNGVGYNHGTDSCKYGAAYCVECGAQAPEVITQYDESENAEWHKAALEEWNRRPKIKEAVQPAANTQIMKCGKCRWYMEICAHHHTPSQSKVVCRDFGCRTS